MWNRWFRSLGKTIIFAGLVLVPAATPTAGAVPASLAILRACAANLVRLNRVRIISGATDAETFRGKVVGYGSDMQSLSRCGDKLALKVTQAPMSGLVHGVQISDRLHDQFVWTGGISYFVGRRGPSFIVTFSRKAFRPWRDIAVAGFAVAPVLGILPGDTRPFPTVLRETGMQTHVSRKMVVIKKYQCLHLVASGLAGKYSLWVAPGNGYAVVRAMVSKGPNDSFMGRRRLGQKPHYPKGWPGPKTQPSAAFNTFLDRVTLAHTDGFWYPASFRFASTLRSVAGDVDINTVRAHVRRILLTCPPDSNAFTPKIPDGATIHDMDDPAIQYIWHHGKVVPAYDKAGLKKINKVIDGIRTQGKAYFDGPMVASSPSPAKRAGVPTAATSRFLGDPVAASTSLWRWGAAAIVSVIAAALCVIFVRKRDSRE